MEECEALCTRLAVMVNGKFKCLGSSQHLKSKFSKGYTLIMKLVSHNDSEIMAASTRRLMDFVAERFPNSLLKDEHEGLLNYQINTPGLTWANVFGIIERAKDAVRDRRLFSRTNDPRTTVHQLCEGSTGAAGEQCLVHGQLYKIVWLLIWIVCPQSV